MPTQNFPAIQSITSLLRLEKTNKVASGSSFFVPDSAKPESALEFLIANKERSLTVVDILRSSASEACLQIYLLSCKIPILLSCTNDNDCKYVEPQALAIALDPLRYLSDAAPLSEQDVALLSSRLQNSIESKQKETQTLRGESGMTSLSPFVSVNLAIKEIEKVGFHKLLYLCNTGNEIVGVYERVENIADAQFTSRYRTVFDIAQLVLKEFEIELFKGELNKPESKLKLSFVNTKEGFVGKALQQTRDITLVFNSEGYPSLVSCAYNYVISNRTIDEIVKYSTYHPILDLGSICAFQENPKQEFLQQILDYSGSLQTIVLAALCEDPEGIKISLDNGFSFKAMS